MSNPSTPFQWMVDSEKVSIFREKASQICGYASVDTHDSKPANLHMQFACPSCKERVDLGVYPFRERFLVSIEKYYDLEFEVDSKYSKRDGRAYYHKDYVIKKWEMDHSPNRALKGLQFTFIHQCASCGFLYDTMIAWKENSKAFELTLWPYENDSRKNLCFNPTQIWEFTGTAYLHMKDTTSWSNVMYSRGYGSGWRNTDCTKETDPYDSYTLLKYQLEIEDMEEKAAEAKKERVQAERASYFQRHRQQKEPRAAEAPAEVKEKQAEIEEKEGPEESDVMRWTIERKLKGLDIHGSFFRASDSEVAEKERTSRRQRGREEREARDETAVEVKKGDADIMRWEINRKRKMAEMAEIPGGFVQASDSKMAEKERASRRQRGREEREARDKTAAEVKNEDADVVRGTIERKRK